MKLILLTIILLVSFGCQEEQRQIVPESIQIDKEKIALMTNQFNFILTKNATLDFYKIKFKEIPGSPALNNFLSVLNMDDLKIANSVLNHKFFNKVFYGGSSVSQRTQEEEILTGPVDRAIGELIASIETIVKNFIPSSDLENDKILLSNTLSNLITSFELDVTNDGTLNSSDRNIFID